MQPAAEQGTPAPSMRWVLITGMSGAGRTIVLITHNADHVQNHCDRCIILDKTEKVYDGDATTGAAKYRQLFSN